MAQATTKYGPGIIKHTAAAALTSGDVVDIGSRVGVFAGLNAAASGDLVTLMIEGVFTMTALSTDTWSDGDLIYWDDTNNRLTATSTSNTPAGLAVGAKVSGTTTADVDISCRA